MSAENISIIAALIAGLSALYARRAVTESKKSNELNRFNALLELKSSYLDEMKNQMSSARDWGKDDSYTQACRDAYEKAQEKYREVNAELNSFHTKIVNNEI